MLITIKFTYYADNEMDIVHFMLHVNNAQANSRVFASSRDTSKADDANVSRETNRHARESSRITDIVIPSLSARGSQSSFPIIQHRSIRLRHNVDRIIAGIFSTLT